MRDAYMIKPREVESRVARETQENFSAAPRIMQHRANFAGCREVHGGVAQGFGGLRRINFDRLDGLSRRGEAFLELRLAVASGKIDETARDRQARANIRRESLGIRRDQRRAFKAPFAGGLPRPFANQEQRQQAARLGQWPVRRRGQQFECARAGRDNAIDDARGPYPAGRHQVENRREHRLMPFARQARGGSLRFLERACKENQHAFCIPSQTFEMGLWWPRPGSTGRVWGGLRVYASGRPASNWSGRSPGKRDA